MADTGSKVLYVIKRNGERETILFDKITERLRVLCRMEPALPSEVEPILVAQKVIQGVYSGIKTTELDTLAAETAAYMSTTHHEYGTLAARIAISNLHKETSTSFADTIALEHGYVNPKTGEASPLIADDIQAIIQKNRDKIDSYIDYRRDFDYDYFGFRTMERSYLVRLNSRVVERPQHMLMRVAIGIHGENLALAFKTYDYMSNRLFTHATPTLFNAGTRNPQLSSCFLVAMKDDTIEGIYETLKQTAMISKSAGGIGLSISNIRASHSYIKGTNGTSNGLVPMLRVFNDTARYVDQGGGKRKGAFAAYLEPWHADVLEFLDLKKPHGKEEFRARDLFFALWIPDLFMRRVEANEDWSLFCPNEAPGLFDVWGAEFDALYAKYEQEGRYRKKIKAQDLWFSILESQIETGTPYILFKDACNRKSNQQNLGTIRSSNLCCEIVEYSSPDEVAVCNLASLSLPAFVKDGKFDHDKLFEVTYHVTGNLNRVIDINYYPIPEAKKSNLRHRPIGIGVQGLADVFIKLRLPFDSPEAKKLNSEIFETIYFAALTASKDLAIGCVAYETFQGSPASRGILQFDMWGITPSKRWDWATLKEEIIGGGLRNSLLVAPMPTASTSQILGNQEASEPYTTNIYSRRVLAGEFTVLNKYLLDDLMKLGLWTPAMKNQIIAERGSVQNIASIPQDIKDLYKTVWEIKMKDLIDMAADRGAFIDQSQSFNCFVANPTPAKLTSMHFYGWKKGLKTGCYYLRTQNVVNAIQFTVDQRELKKSREVVNPPSSNTAVRERVLALNPPTNNGPTVTTLNLPAKASIDAHMVREKEAFLAKGWTFNNGAYHRTVKVTKADGTVDDVAVSMTAPVFQQSAMSPRTATKFDVAFEIVKEAGVSNPATEVATAPPATPTFPVIAQLKEQLAKCSTEDAKRKVFRDYFTAVEYRARYTATPKLESTKKAIEFEQLESKEVRNLMREVLPPPMHSSAVSHIASEAAPAPRKVVTFREPPVMESVPTKQPDTLTRERVLELTKRSLFLEPLSPDYTIRGVRNIDEEVKLPVTPLNILFGAPPMLFKPTGLLNGDDANEQEWEAALWDTARSQKASGGPGPFYTAMSYRTAPKQFVLYAIIDPLLRKDGGVMSDLMRWHLDRIIPNKQTPPTPTVEGEICTMEEGCLSCGS